MRRFVLLIACLTAVVASYAESPYTFQSLTTADGLSGSSVKCMLTDSRGFLWIGTDMGLDRYDGYEVEPMTGLFGAEWQSCAVDEVQEDALGNLWIDCQYTYLIYKVRSLTPVVDASGVLKGMGIDVGDDAYKVKVDGSGGLWVLQQGRLWHYDCHTRRTRQWRNAHFGLGDVNFYACSATSDGILLAGRHAVWQFSAVTGQMEQLALPADMQRPDNVYGTYIDADSSLWVFSIIDEKICRYSKDGKTVREMISLPPGSTADSRNNAIRDMMDDGQGNLWIATDHKGIFVYHKQPGTLTQLSQLSSNNVISLTMDRQGTVWAGHFKTGISYTSANPRMFQNRGQQYGDVIALYNDSKGRLWIGTDGNGLYMERRDGTSVKAALPNITVSCITEDSEGTLWVGSYSEGIFRQLPDGRFQQLGLANGKFPTNSGWCLADDGRGGLWCASSANPLVRLDTRTGRWQVMKDEQGDDILGTGMAVDRRGNLLIASTYGLFVYDREKGHRYLTNFKGTQEMEPKMATSLCYDSRRDLLLLGHRQGLTIFDMANDTLYFAGSGHQRPLAVKSIVQDPQGTFWLSTAQGITQLVVHRAKDGQLRWEVKNYTSREGLQSPFFNGNAATVTADGQLLFGGIEGYTIVSPTTPHSTFNTPRINTPSPQITRVTAGDRPIIIDNDRIVLNHDDNHVDIRYFAGILNNANRLRYAYKIEGMMGDWAYTEENHITLVGLSPGDYHLLLKVSDVDDSPVCRLAIHVNPPFYLTWWAFLVYGLLIALAALLLWLHIRRRKLLKLRQKQFVEWAGKSHQDFKKRVEVKPSEVTITPLDEQFLQKAIKLVEEQMGNSDLTVETLGQQLGMSRSFLYKKLMSITGLGPAEFIRTIRIKRGMALLERSQLQITEIAYKVGFNSLKSFTMNFKAEYGMTPSEYLKKHGNRAQET